MSPVELTHNTTASPAIDFMALLGRCMGNFQMVERVLSTFRTTGQSDLNQLQQAIESADLTAVTEIAHRFQGAASNVSATRLREVLKQAERLGREQNRTELLMIMGRLQPEWEEFERYAETMAPATSSPSGIPSSHSKPTPELCHAGARR